MATCRSPSLKNLSQVPATHHPRSSPATESASGTRRESTWGTGGTTRKNITPLFPFGYGLSYTRFKFSNLAVSPQTTDGVHNVHVSATITNTGARAGTDVAQLYLGDPASSGEPPRQLVAYKRVTVGAGKSTAVRFTISPPNTWWWDQSAPGGSSTGGGWSQTAGTYRVYVGDSSALSNLPLRGAFNMTSTPAARQVEVSAPATMKAGAALDGHSAADRGGQPDAVRRPDLPAGPAGLEGGAAHGRVRPGVPLGRADGDVHGDTTVLRAEHQPDRARDGQPRRIGHP